MQLATSFTKDLDYTLTPDEIRASKDRVVSLLVDLEDAEEEKARVTRQHAEKVKGLKRTLREETRRADTGKGRRQVLCSERAQTRTFTIETYRHDTGQVIDSRAMNADEVEEARQTGLFDGGGVRVADAPKGGLDLAMPAPPESGAAPIVGSDAPDVDGAEITNPEGLLNGKEAKKGGKGKRKGKGMKIAPATPTETVGLAAIVTGDETDEDDDADELADDEPDAEPMRDDADDVDSDPADGSLE